MQMKDYSALGVTQKIMSQLTNLNPSSVNKYVMSHSYDPIDASINRNIRYSIPNTRKIIKDLEHKNRFQGQSTMCFYNFKGGVG